MRYNNNSRYDKQCVDDIKKQYQEVIKPAYSITYNYDYQNLGKPKTYGEIGYSHNKKHSPKNKSKNIKVYEYYNKIYYESYQVKNKYNYSGKPDSINLPAKTDMERNLNNSDVNLIIGSNQRPTNKSSTNVPKNKTSSREIPTHNADFTKIGKVINTDTKE